MIVANFLFLASLALIPVATKWIMHEENRYSTVHFGAIYMLTSILLQFLYYSALRKRFRDNIGLFFIMILSRMGFLLGISAVLMLISWFQPHWAVILYIILPVVSFFMPW